MHAVVHAITPPVLLDITGDGVRRRSDGAGLDNSDPRQCGHRFLRGVGIPQRVQARRPSLVYRLVVSCTARAPCHSEKRQQVKTLRHFDH